MPLMHLGMRNIFSIRVAKANTLLARIVGLLGTSEPDVNMALLIPSCNQIHTVGMAYPIDVVWLDRKGEVVKTQTNIQPNRITGKIRAAYSILELASGSIHKLNIHEGDILHVKVDELFRPNFNVLKNILHWPVNIFIALLWSRLVFTAFDHWSLYHHPMYLCILIHNTILMFFFLTRRKSKNISSRISDWLIPILTLCCAMLLRPSAFILTQITLFSGMLQYIGIVAILMSLLSLGRSFGIVPANRNIVSAGAYKIVRHPLYLSEMIFYIGFVMGNPVMKNIILICLILIGQLWRSISEESILSLDSDYCKYKQRVKYRFLPGLF